MLNFRNNEDLILEKVIDNLKERYSDNIISIYGIGSYFDESIHSDWIKKDGERLAKEINANNFIETSAKQGDNVDKAFKNLVLQILSRSRRLI